MKQLLVISLIILFSFLSNCATASAGIATSNIPIVDQKYSVIGPVEKSKHWFTIDFAFIGIPLSKPPVDTIIQEAINEKEADALINIRHWNDKIIILFVTINRFGINAEAVKFENDPKKK
ncbi:LIC20211 family lipoprotein [Leptospira sp. GIMC2001]|uniref:LIC20211 family lipoprotein n=1 Tax=Leptospira sp. GIMC2001 TaxID=1513297 RepID=UPI002349D093|nr:hypothetical protein [Leptospira sp. GIMC2001]WCL47689.1 hypothetical protein O4O04_00090 [Leptospira sp. GIMC2001]